jgi:tetratricopeptide (TPR) repeat protein
LRNAVEGSFASLSDEERNAIAALSLFRGGFTVETATSVLAALGTSAMRAIDVVQSLTEKSLLFRRTTDDDGRARFDMYVGIREVAAEQFQMLAARRNLQRAHVACFLAKALDDPSALRREQDNVLAALGYATDDGDDDSDTERALSLCGVLALFAVSWSPSTFIPWFSKALGATAEPRASVPVRIQARIALGILLAHTGDLAPAIRHFDEGEALGIRNGHVDCPALTATARLERATAFRSLGRIDEAEHEATALVNDAVSRNDDRLHARAQSLLGALRSMRGANEDAVGAVAKAVGLFERLGDRRDEGRARARLGFLLLDHGDVDGADTQFRRALELHRALGAVRDEGVVLGYLGNIGQHRATPRTNRRCHPALR